MIYSAQLLERRASEYWRTGKKIDEHQGYAQGVATKAGQRPPGWAGKDGDWNREDQGKIVGEWGASQYGGSKAVICKNGRSFQNSGVGINKRWSQRVEEKIVRWICKGDEQHTGVVGGPSQ